MELAMSDVKPTVLSFVTVTIMAVTGIVLLKWFVSKYPIPGLSEIVTAV